MFNRAHKRRGEPGDEATLGVLLVLLVQLHSTCCRMCFSAVAPLPGSERSEFIAGCSSTTSSMWHPCSIYRLSIHIHVHAL